MLKIQQRILKVPTYLEAFLLSFAHLESLGMMITLKALKRKMVPMDTSLPTLGTEKASVHPKLPVLQEFLSNEQLRVWRESLA